MAGGVPILHLIAAPFPSVWHQIGDNRDALDYNTLCAWARIGQVALVEYFGLLKYIEPSSSRKRDELVSLCLFFLKKKKRVGGAKGIGEGEFFFSELIDE